MKKKIIIVGKRSFIGINLHKYFKKNKINVALLSYKSFVKKNIFFIKKFDYLINCSTNFDYINKVYKEKNDQDLNIARKIVNSNCKLVFLGTRKIYQPKYDIRENGKKRPKCNYSRNKFITEKLLNKIQKNKVLILRISNVIGLPKKNKEGLHDTFINVFLKNVKKRIIFENKNIYKDFLSIEKLCEIILILIELNCKGVYNVSLGKKVYLNQIIKWLNNYNDNQNKLMILNNKFIVDSFTLNNKKLMNKIKITNNLEELKESCIQLSKKIFIK